MRFRPAHRELNQEVLEEALKSGFPLALCRWLALHRGITTHQDLRLFLSRDQKELHDPFLLSDMEKAVLRIRQAFENNEKILIFGDFDVDGLCASSVLYWGLKKARSGYTPEVFIPNRFTEGHGLRAFQIEQFKGMGIKVIITADCGMGSCSEITLAREAGIDVIVTDHHLPEEELSDAFAVVNPRLGSYPFLDLAGVGVAYKLIQALIQHIYGAGSEVLYSTSSNLVEYVAIGTIADVVPLLGENRILVQAGLEHMSRSPFAFLKSFWAQKILKTDMLQLEPDQVSFFMAPRLNSASRLDSAWPAFRFLIAKNEEETIELGSLLEELNRQRVARLLILKQKADLKVYEFHNLPLVIVDTEGPELGLLGLLAASVSEQYGLSAIALGRNPEGLISGSARGIAGVHLTEILGSVSEYLLNFGGHAQAAGVRLKPENLHLFLQALRALPPLAKVEMEAPHFDAELDIAEVSDSFMLRMQALGPFGVANPRPVFALKEYKTIRPRIVGSAQKDLSLEIEAMQGQRFVAIGFGKASLKEDIDQAALVCSLNYNYFGQRKIQFQILGQA